MAEPQMALGGIDKMPFQEQAKFVVMQYVRRHFDKSDLPIRFHSEDVYVVWWSKVLQNWKALLSTNLPDGMYYEVTFNGDKDEIYLDAYKKFENQAFVLERETV